MWRRCKTDIPELIGKARLPDYRLAFDKKSPGWNCGVADIVKKEGSEVWGLIYEVTEECLKKLDFYEGHPGFYRRFNVTVEDEGAEKVEALSYEVVDKEPFIPPSVRYLDIIKDAAREHDFPVSYRTFLESIETT